MGLNDPQWGNKNGGPPDLEALLKKLKVQLSVLLGQKTGPGNKGPANSGLPALSGGALGLLAVIAVMIWLASGFYIVDASQRGVVLRFGKQVEVTLAGPRWHIPYPVEAVENAMKDLPNVNLPA